MKISTLILTQALITKVTTCECSELSPAQLDLNIGNDPDQIRVKIKDGLSVKIIAKIDGLIQAININTIFLASF